MTRIGKSVLRLLLFAAALLAAGLPTAADRGTLDQSPLWLPSGVAIAGVWLLGARAVWLVAVTTLLTRLSIGYAPVLAVPAALGSAAEAFVGCWLLQRLQVRAGLARLRDVAGVYLAAAVAPLFSIVASWIGRVIGQPDPLQPFYSGWGGWWRMNAIGILAVVPLALAWSGPSRRPLQLLLEAAGWAAATVALVASVIGLMAPGVPAILSLVAVLPVAFLAALRLGNRGATATALVGALAIAVTTTFGVGPFEAVVRSDRHVVVQIILVAIAALPLLFGALLAERDSNATRWLQSESLGQALLRLLPDVTYRLRADGTIVDAVAPAGSRPPDSFAKVIGRRIQDVVGHDFGDRLLQQVRLAHRNEQTEAIDYATTVGGRQTERELRFVHVPNGEVLVVARDITQRKHAERQLTLQASILEMVAKGRSRTDVFEALVAGVESLIPDGRCSILQLHGDRLYVTTAPALPEAYNQIVDGLQIGPNSGACGTAAYLDQVIICDDLRTDARWQDVHSVVERFGLGACWSVPIHSSDGAVLGTFAIYHDGPRQPEPDEIGLVGQAAVLAGLTLDRERREGLLASIQQNVTDGLYRSIPGEGFAYVNASFARLLGYDSGEQLLREWSSAPPGPHRDSLQLLVNEATSLHHRELHLHRRDGSPFWALVSTNITVADRGGERICDGTLTDITANRALEDQLRQAQKMDAVGQLAGGIAHDFNNLLTAIIGFGESVHDALPVTSPLRHDVDQILDASQRAAALTRQLLAFGRRQVLSPQVFELPAVVEQIGDMLRRLIGEHIQLRFERPRASVRTRADRSQLEQVVLNLVINARDAMPQGGRIILTIDSVTIGADANTRQADLAPGRYAVLRVRDTGTGMSVEVQARAFDPFFTTKQPGQGTGLGLSTVYGIVKQSGGTVTIESEPGQGTTVSVYLPFADQEPDQETMLPLSLPPRCTGTVLVVEDEPFVLELAVRALRKAGHEVLTAHDGKAALQRFDAHRNQIDLVATDVVMPQMSGSELAHELRLRQPELRILFVSGYAEDTIELPTPDQRQNAFLQKPFTATQLVDQVNRMLAARPEHAARAAPTSGRNVPHGN